VTVIAVAYDSPTSYALAADSHSLVNGLRIPSQKGGRIGVLLIGGAGSGTESKAGIDYLTRDGAAEAQRDPRAALAAMRLHILATTERGRDCSGLDSHFIAVHPDGVFVLGSDGGISEAPHRWAVGCGEHMAIGAMYQREGAPADVVRLAVEAACAMADGCFGTARVLVP
jgi:hypothetical protein